MITFLISIVSLYALKPLSLSKIQNSYVMWFLKVSRSKATHFNHFQRLITRLSTFIYCILWVPPMLMWHTSITFVTLSWSMIMHGEQLPVLTSTRSLIKDVSIGLRSWKDMRPCCRSNNNKKKLLNC